MLSNLRPGCNHLVWYASNKVECRLQKNGAWNLMMSIDWYNVILVTGITIVGLLPKDMAFG